MDGRSRVRRLARRYGPPAADGPGRPSTGAVRGRAGRAPGRPGRAAVGLDCPATRGPRPPGAGRGGQAGSVHDRAGQRPLDPPGPGGGCGRARAAGARTCDERGCVDDDDYGRSQAAAERPGATWPRPLTPRRTRRSPWPKNVPRAGSVKVDPRRGQWLVVRAAPVWWQPSGRRVGHPSLVVRCRSAAAGGAAPACPGYGSKRYPSPGSVSRWTGAAGSGSSLRRSWAM